MSSRDIFEEWKHAGTVIDVEITVGHVWMSFTGRVTYTCRTEVILSHEDGELSISLFCCPRHRVIEPRSDSEADFWKKYRRVVQVTTDGGAVCTLHERLPVQSADGTTDTF